MSCFIDFIDINLWEKYTLTNLVSIQNRKRLSLRFRWNEGESCFFGKMQVEIHFLTFQRKKSVLE